MIWNFCIRRPVLTIVVFLVFAIFGVWSYLNMPRRENPDVEFPYISVNVVLPGAEPEVIETEIIDPLEQEINTAEGLKTLTSTAREQVATITAEFELWRDVDIAAQDVRDRVSRARRELPDGAEEPIVRKIDPDAQPVMWLTLTGDARWDVVRLSRYADETLRERIENVRGVGRVLIGGERRYAVRVEVDPQRLAAHHLTIQDVVAAIRANNVDVPSGRVESKDREFLVDTRGQFSGPGPINDIIVTSRDGRPVRVGDVARARDGVENDRQLARFNRKPTVGLGVVKRSGANTVRLAEAVRERIKQLAEDFPAGLTYTVGTDQAVYIRESIRDLLTTIFIAAGLVVLVVVAFLRNAWGTLIAGLSIPASLLIGLAAMHVLGFSVNTLTMLALILAIGIVVDDAIVILESSYRHLEQGAASIPAARVGTTEVAFAALANTAALGAVFIPVAFTAGLIGRFFFEFGITVAATIFASTFTALTLTPMLSSRLLRAPSGHGLLYRTSQRAYNALEGAYAKLLNLAMAHRLATILVALAALVGAGLAARGLSTEFMPAVDRGQFLISFEMPEGATLWRTDAYARKLERVLDETPEVEQFFLAIGLSRGAGPGKVNTGVSFVRLIDRSRRGRGQLEIMQELRRRFAKIPDGQAFVIEMSAIGQAGAELQLVLQNPDIDALAARQDEVMAWMRGRSEFVGVNTNLKMNKPEVEVSILRDKARSLGVAALSISDTMRLVLGEPDISEIERRAERYEIIPEVAWKGRMVPEDIGQLYVRADGGDLVSLENVTEQVEATGPSEIHHYNRIRSAQISSSTPPGVPLGKAVGALSDHLDRTLPTGFQYTYAGQSQEFQDAFANLSVTIVFSIAFVFLALSAQFESFLHPLAIFVTLPLAAVGAFGALWIGGLSLGVFAYIGLIMLMGMATKNGILMIDYSNVLVARGQEVHDAARQAARIRFRPVVMTTVSTVLGIMPIALGYGAGGTARRPMGVAVAVGLTTTTLLTLVVLPVVYTLIQDTHGWVARQVGRRQGDAKAGR